MPGELVTIQSAASIVATLMNATSGLVAQVRATGAVRAEQRERLNIALTELRRHDIAAAIKRLSVQNMDDVCFLYDYAETKAGSAGYAKALESAELSARLLLNNLDRFAQDIR